MKRFIFLCLCLIAVRPVFAQNLEKDLDLMLTGYVDAGKLHGCVAYVQQGDAILHYKAYGFQNVKESIKMEKDVIFEISSMTKVITAAGALKLYEEGKFKLDDPVKMYLPQFSNLKVLENMDTDSARLVSPVRDVTIRDLFRHTAGFGYGWSDDTVDSLYRVNRITAANQAPENFLNTITRIPLKFQPGTRWEYSLSIDILGILVEKISGVSLQESLARSLFVPLKMKNTGFYLSESNIDKLSAKYTFAGGKLNQSEYPLPSQYLRVPPMYWGGAGILTTAGDLANFYNMILHYGNFRGKQVLKPETIELMISDQIGEISNRSFDLPGYGLGVGVIPGTNHGKTKSVFWSGSPYNTCFFIDFEKNLIGIFLTQNGPFGHLDIIKNFGEIVNADVK